MILKPEVPCICLAKCQTTHLQLDSHAFITNHLSLVAELATTWPHNLFILVRSSWLWEIKLIRCWMLFFEQFLHLNRFLTATCQLLDFCTAFTILLQQLWHDTIWQELLSSLWRHPITNSKTFVQTHIQSQQRPHSIYTFAECVWVRRTPPPLHTLFKPIWHRWEAMWIHQQKINAFPKNPAPCREKS